MDQNYRSFVAGIEGQLWDIDNLWFSFYLKYTRLNFEEVMESLDLSARDFKSVGGSSDGIGMGLGVYYDLFSAL